MSQHPRPPPRVSVSVVMEAAGVAVGAEPRGIATQTIHVDARGDGDPIDPLATPVVGLGTGFRPGSAVIAPATMALVNAQGCSKC